MTDKLNPSLNTPQMALPITLSDKACFENFWSASNYELVTALKHAVTLGEPKLVYYYGAVGVGKSHLLFASMRLAQAQMTNTSYLALGDLMLNGQAMSEVMLSVDVTHIVCVDDVQAWAGNARAEEALFSLFEQIKHAGGQLIINASGPASELGIKLPDLVSRLSSGLVYPLNALDDQQQLKAIKMRADYRGMAISDDAVKYMLSRLPRDSALLFGLLDEIDRVALTEKRKITIPFLQALFKKQS